MGENLNKTEKSSEIVPKKAKIAYGLTVSGQTGMALIGSYLVKYYTDFLGMQPIFFGYAHLSYASINAINDPIVGIIIDRAREKPLKNKYKRFMYLSAPFFITGLFFQLLGQPGWDNLLLFFCVLLGFSFLDTGNAMCGISAQSLIYRSTKSDSERSSFIGTALIFQTFFGMTMFLSSSYFLTSSSNYIQPFLMFLGFGIAGFFVYLLGTSLFPVFKRSYGTKQMEGLKITFKRIIHQKYYYAFLIIAFTMNGIAFNHQVFMLYILDDLLDFPGEFILFVSAFALPLNFVLYIMSRRIVKKIGLKKSFFICTGILLVSYFGIFISLNQIVSLILLIIITLGINFWWILATPITGIVIDEYERIYKENKSAIFLGINSIFLSPAVSIVIFIFTSIITLFGYNGTVETQSELAKIGLRVGLGLVPFIFVLIALLGMFLLIQTTQKFKKIKN